MKKYDGIFIPTHKIVDVASKEKASSTLSNWHPDCLTAEKWIDKLDEGQTIQPSMFSPQEDGTFTHKIEYWDSTHFICADGDNISGVEFLDDGSDKNPDGIPAWQEDGQLSVKFPELLSEVYAVGESVTSMLREPKHRRFRIIFLFDEPIADETHYRHILSQLAEKYPIIPKGSRSPAQPVFGNGREGFNFYIAGNILKLEDFPMPQEPQQTQTEWKKDTPPNESLEDFLRRNHIVYESAKESNKYFLDCPYRDKHTGQKQGPTDSYVFDDGTGWAFYCAHDSCKPNRTWQAFKTGHGINGKPQAPKTYQKPPPIEKEPPIEDEIEQSDEDPIAVTFPEELFYGVFESYRKAIEGKTPVPDAFAFATLKHIISASLGRRIHLESQIPIYANVFTGLIGESSTAHKGVSLNVAQQLIQRADPNVLVLSKVTTEEGLIDLFNTPELKERDTDENGEGGNYYINGVADLLPFERVDEIVANIDSHESIRIMGSFEELSAVLNQSKKVTFSGMTERFMELYDMRDEILIGNKQVKTRADYPTFTMMGASAFELIEQSLAQYFITAGFTNRIEWYLGEEKEVIFLYKMADSQLWTETINGVKQVRENYIAGQSFAFTDTAYNLGDKWNHEFTEQLRDVDNILVSGSMKRMKIFVIKNSLIFAALENRGDHMIHEEDMMKAMILSQYNCTVVEKLFGNFASSEHQRVCNRIVEILKKTPMLSAKNIQNRMKWADIKDIDLALELMLKMGMLGARTPKRSTLYYVSKYSEEPQI